MAPEDLDAAVSDVIQPRLWQAFVDHSGDSHSRRSIVAAATDLMRKIHREFGMPGSTTNRSIVEVSRAPRRLPGFRAFMIGRAHPDWRRVM